MIMINCPNANLKNYIFKLQHENAELKKCFLEIKDILELPKYEPIEENSLEYYSFLSSVINNQIKILKELVSTKPSREIISSIEINFPIIQHQQNLLKKLKGLFSEYRLTQMGKDLRPRETEYLYRIESLLNKLKD